MVYIIKPSLSFSPELLTTELAAPFHQVHIPQSLKICLCQDHPLPFPGLHHGNFFIHLQGLSNCWHRRKADRIVAKNITAVESKTLKTSFLTRHDIHVILGFQPTVPDYRVQENLYPKPYQMSINIRPLAPEQLRKLTSRRLCSLHSPG